DRGVRNNCAYWYTGGALNAADGRRGERGAGREGFFGFAVEERPAGVDRPLRQDLAGQTKLEAFYRLLFARLRYREAGAGIGLCRVALFFLEKRTRDRQPPVEHSVFRAHFVGLGNFRLQVLRRQRDGGRVADDVAALRPRGTAPGEVARPGRVGLKHQARAR